MTAPLHLNADAPVEARAASLLSEMTIEERCGQLTSTMAWGLLTPGGDPAEGAIERLRTSPPGHVAQLILANPHRLANMVGSLQRLNLDATRLAVPLLFHAEALNGFLNGGHMVFPTAIGLAATWHPELVGEMASLIRKQMRRVGMAHVLSPVMDVAIDPRWGRVHETYGEDPYLAAAFSVAYTSGMQTDDLTHGVVATGKHFLGYANPEGGVNASIVPAGPRRLRDLYAYPFEAAIRLAGLRSVMNSYSELDGIPVAASEEILIDLLRGQLGFRGFVSADYGSLEHLVSRQRVARTPGEAAALGIAAGLDVEFPQEEIYGATLAAEVHAGSVPIEHVDRSVLPVLEAKFALGLFNLPSPSERIDVAAVAQEGEGLSRALAAEGVVLLRNDGLLPVREPRTSRVAVIGPHADAASLQFPTYTYASWRQAVEAERAGSAGTMVGADTVLESWWVGHGFVSEDIETLVRSAGATPLSDELDDRFADTAVVPGAGLQEALGDDAISSAVAAAEDADLAVLALGGASLWFNGVRTEGEASDTADIALPQAQVALADAVLATGTPTVIVLFQGRPYALPSSFDAAGALIVAAYGGPHGPSAVAAVITGEIEPTGRLPYSIPRHSGQIPVYHHQKVGSGRRTALGAGRAAHYLDMPAVAEHPFGAGLGYADVAFGELQVDPAMTTSGAVVIRCAVSADTATTTVVQLYLSGSALGVTRPAQQLAGFVRLDVPAGGRREVEFTVPAALLGFSAAGHRIAVEPGEWDLFIGRSSEDRALEGSFTVTGARRILAGEERAFLSTVVVR